MKNLIIFVALSLFSVSCCSGDLFKRSDYSDIVKARDLGSPSYATLTNIIASIGSDQKTLVIDGGEWVISQNVTIPTNIVLDIRLDSFFSGAGVVTYLNRLTDSTATGKWALADGTQNDASGDYSVAFGEETTASGLGAMSIGLETTASGDYSMAAGIETIASGDYSMAIGSSNTASGIGSIACGTNTTASEDYSIATGDKTIASGYASRAGGFNNQANGDSSVAEGQSNEANGTGSYVDGWSNTADGNYSKASGISAHAVGYACYVWAGGGTSITNDVDRSYMINATGGIFLNSEKINIQSIPTNSSGLVSGDIWRDGTSLKIVE